MAKIVKFDSDARASMLKGVDILANTCLLYTSDAADD